METLKKLKSFIVLLLIMALLAVFWFIPAVRSWLLGRVSSLLSEANTKDKEHLSKYNEAQKKIDEIKSKVEDIDKKLSDLNKEEDLEWHKKKQD